MQHGPQAGLFDLAFSSPAECARRFASGEADIGIIPSFELPLAPVEIIPGIGIASRGPVRSILLISRLPLEQVRTLAADQGSRTSVALARWILEQRYGAVPEILSRPPELDSMLREAGAALIIGDPALRIEPPLAGLRVCDLGEEWTEMTGLPMVFAVWAGRPGAISPEVSAAFQASWRFGRERLEEIARGEAGRRRIPPELALRYLTQHIRFELGAEEYQGLERYLQCVHGAGAAGHAGSGCLTSLALPRYTRDISAR